MEESLKLKIFRTGLALEYEFGELSSQKDGGLKPHPRITMGTL